MTMIDKKNCKNCRNNFSIEIDDASFYEKIGVQEPRLCPACRAQLRLAFRSFCLISNIRFGDMFIGFEKVIADRGYTI